MKIERTHSGKRKSTAFESLYYKICIWLWSFQVQGYNIDGNLTTQRKLGPKYNLSFRNHATCCADLRRLLFITLRDRSFIALLQVNRHHTFQRLEQNNECRNYPKCPKIYLSNLSAQVWDFDQKLHRASVVCVRNYATS